jgi:uncharacterized membrane protein YdjX (TVP38/TMEM64 family)
MRFLLANPINHLRFLYQTLLDIAEKDGLGFMIAICLFLFVPFRFASAIGSRIGRRVTAELDAQMGGFFAGALTGLLPALVLVSIFCATYGEDFFDSGPMSVLAVFVGTCCLFGWWSSWRAWNRKQTIKEIDPVERE